MDKFTEFLEQYVMALSKEHPSALSQIYGKSLDTPGLKEVLFLLVVKTKQFERMRYAGISDTDLFGLHALNQIDFMAGKIEYALEAENFPTLPNRYYQIWDYYKSQG